jgi:putative dimethyl sulfoxide reductase chaperone
MVTTDDVRAEARQNLARGAIYRILALGFASPRPEIVNFVGDGLARNLVELVALLPSDVSAELTGAVEGLTPAVGSLGEIEGEYNRLFRTALACTPYETEYDPMRSVRKGHVLADIVGFYTAFGLQPSGKQGELPDHIGMELEFMSLLLQKEAYARLHDWTEKVEVCADGQRKFLNDHLGTWVFAFCDRLEETSVLEFYRGLARLLSAFMTHEIRTLGLEPAKRAGGDPPSEEGPCTCPLSGHGLGPG